MHRRKRARLRRVAERRARAVNLHVLHLGRRERRARPRVPCSSMRCAEPMGAVKIATTILT